MMLSPASTRSFSCLLTTWVVWCLWFSPVLSTDGSDGRLSPDCHCNTTTAVPMDTCRGPSGMNVHDKAEQSQSDPWYRSEQANSFTGNADDYWEEFECDALFSRDSQRPVHDAATWQFLRGVYLGVVGPQLATIAADDLFRKDGFAVPIKVAHIPKKGRGIIALEDIPEGTLVWESVHTARFPSPTTYRRFLASLPDDLACDVMLWAYVEDYPEEAEGDSGATPRPTISVDLDAGSFMNTVSINDVKNLNPETYQTNRLVRAGEELIVDYSDFEKEGAWNAAGFGTKYKLHQ